jgi:hypothetical protein
VQIEICSLDASHQMTKLKFLHCVKSHTLTVVARRFFGATMTQLGDAPASLNLPRQNQD